MMGLKTITLTLGFFAILSLCCADQGITCPNDENKTCLPGQICVEKSGKTFCVRTTRKVAFHAYITNLNKHMPHGTVLVFPIVSVNDGLGYNPKSGIFKAPFTGLYKFTVHVCSGPKKHMVVAIFKGKKQISSSTIYDGITSSCSSHTALARVDKGEEVTAVARWSDSVLYSGTWRWSSFTGFLMYRYGKLR